MLACVDVLRIPDLGGRVRGMLGTVFGGWTSQCPADSENKFITTTPPRIIQMPMMAARSRCCLNTSQPTSATSTMPAPDQMA